MGMDVFGLGPAGNGAGSYFRASIWEWRPILERLTLLCGDILDDDMLNAMSVNEGAGPEDQETCDAMAERLERWLAEDSRDEFFLENDWSILRVDSEGRFLSEKELAENPTLVTYSPYSVSRSGLEEFVTFLRNCGGFSVC